MTVILSRSDTEQLSAIKFLESYGFVEIQENDRQIIVRRVRPFTAETQYQLYMNRDIYRDLPKITMPDDVSPLPIIPSGPIGVSRAFYSTALAVPTEAEFEIRGPGKIQREELSKGTRYLVISGIGPFIVLIKYGGVTASCIYGVPSLPLRITGSL